VVAAAPGAAAAAAVVAAVENFSNLQAAGLAALDYVALDFGAVRGFVADFAVFALAAAALGFEVVLTAVDPAGVPRPAGCL
jgi:hypothetical protein